MKIDERSECKSIINFQIPECEREYLKNLLAKGGPSKDYGFGSVDTKESKRGHEKVERLDKQN